MLALILRRCLVLALGIAALALFAPRPAVRRTRQDTSSSRSRAAERDRSS
jgi:hypothetical protein